MLMSSSLLQGKYHQLYQSIVQITDPSRIFTDPMNTLAWGTDASFYRLVPKIVIKAHSEEEISGILQSTHALNIPVTFRAAGTSLSGQAVTDSVLIVASDQWKHFQILENGHKIKLQPGITGGKVNSLLAPYGRKIGPDPASINAAMVGGMAANNASGMCCGTADNSYQTVESMRIIQETTKAKKNLLPHILKF
jgi:D-lactate dehydrogenase